MPNKAEKDIEQVRKVLNTLIVWMAQSSGSPISVADAEILLKELNAE